MSIILHPGRTVAESPEPLQAFYDMRWRFDYVDRPSAYGPWSRPSNDPELQAWNKNREGLVRACVEGKDRVSGECKVLAECDGWDFINFQWIAQAAQSMALIGKVPPVHTLLGMNLVTRDCNFVCLPTGQVRKVARPEAEKKIQLATFGR